MIVYLCEFREWNLNCNLMENMLLGSLLCLYDILYGYIHFLRSLFFFLFPEYHAKKEINTYMFGCTRFPWYIKTAYYTFTIWNVNSQLQLHTKYDFLGRNLVIYIMYIILKLFPEQNSQPGIEIEVINNVIQYSLKEWT